MRNVLHLDASLENQEHPQIQSTTPCHHEHIHPHLRHPYLIIQTLKQSRFLFTRTLSDGSCLCYCIPFLDHFHPNYWRRTINRISNRSTCNTNDIGGLHYIFPRSYSHRFVRNNLSCYTNSNRVYSNCLHSWASRPLVWNLPHLSHC